MGNLSSLQSLNLMSNQLTSLPESICGLLNTSIDLSSNQLCEEVYCSLNWETPSINWGTQDCGN